MGSRPRRWIVGRSGSGLGVVVLVGAMLAGAAHLAPSISPAYASPLAQRLPAPILVSPSDGAVVTTPMPTFTWTDDGGGATYVFELAAAPPSFKRDGSFSAPQLRVTGMATTSYTVSSSVADGIYSWHAMAKSGRQASSWSTTWSLIVTTGSYIYERLSDPARTVVKNLDGAWLATFTDGARTVTMTGPSRTFSESTATNPVVIATWVRLLPAPFGGAVDDSWLATELIDQGSDVLDRAMQYVTGAPDVYDDAGLRIAGDADFGPLGPDGSRLEGSDFNDFLGIPWTYPDTVDDPESAEYGSLDCSGYMRMVWGYRSGVTLSLSPDGVGLPRRSFEMLDSGPGVVTTTNAGTQVTDFSRLAPGDLVFFDASTDDGTRIDHVGMFLGIDTAGHYRFISSRKTINGPTMGDTAGKSLLDGTGLYATSFRAVRRL